MDAPRRYNRMSEAAARACAEAGHGPRRAIQTERQLPIDGLAPKVTLYKCLRCGQTFYAKEN